MPRDRLVLTVVMATIGTPFTNTAKKVLLCGSGELGKEVVIELQRYGVEVIACDSYENAPTVDREVNSCQAQSGPSAESRWHRPGIGLRKQRSRSSSKLVGNSAGSDTTRQ